MSRYRRGAALPVARAGHDPGTWSATRAETVEAGIAWGYPYRAEALSWEAVAAAERAGDESPVDPLLADAVRAAAATCVFAGRLPAGTRDILLGPWRAAGLAAPTVSAQSGEGSAG